VSREQPVSHVLRRVIGLALLGLCAVAVLLQVEFNVFHTGSYQMTWGVAGVVHAVQPGGVAARAGIDQNDRIAIPALSASDRLTFLYPRAGDRIVLTLQRGSQKRIVALTAAPHPPRGWWGALHLFGYPALVFVALCLASVVVLLRPGRPAWTYYAFAWMSTICAFQDYVYVRGPVALQLAVQAFYQIAFAGALFTLAFFATRSFNAERRWQNRWDLTIFGLAAIDIMAWNYFITGFALGWWDSSLIVPLVGQLADIALATAVLALLSTVVSRSHEEGRQRARWIVVGLSLQPLLVVMNALPGIFTELFSHWSGALVFTPLYRLVEPWAALIAAIAVSYAFINEHLIDIRFAIGRASGYAITSVLLVLFMAVAEWSVSEFFSESMSHAAAYATLVAGILAAFSFNSIHERIDRLLDIAFFRREYLAEQRLKRDARALAFATSERSVVEFLLDEPLNALELSSAALFQLDEDRNAYVCRAVRAWPDDSMIAIAKDDMLVAQLRAERQLLMLADLGWKHDGLPEGAQRPTVAIPALARSDLYAFVLYGAHRDGAILNAEERALLGTLVTSAAATFDHLDAKQAREEIAELKRRLAESYSSLPVPDH
jgi:hypothetical protein